VLIVTMLVLVLGAMGPFNMLVVSQLQCGQTLGIVTNTVLV